MTFTAVLDTRLWDKQLYQKELKHESLVLLLKQLRCFRTTPCCLQTNATLLEQGCMLCCQQFSHCHSIVSVLKQSLTFKTFRKTEMVKKLSKPFHTLLLNWLWLSKLTTWLQCPSGRIDWDTRRFSPSAQTLRKAGNGSCWWEESDFLSCSWVAAASEPLSCLLNRPGSAAREACDFMQTHI